MEQTYTQEYEFLKVSRQDRIAVVAISAPKSLNALNSVIIGELTHFISNIDEDTRALIITGDGEKSFVAGADISEMATLDRIGGCAFGQAGADLFRMIETLPIPVIAAVNGFALGGGCELAMACDIRLASNKAKFGQPEVGLGIIPGFSGTVRLARTVGMGYAKEMIYTGKIIRADEALRIGLVNAIYEPEALMDAAMEMAKKIAANAPIAVRYAKTCINEEWDMNADDAIEFETEFFGRCFDTEDQKEGMQAFLNKTPVEFKNR
ncbi:MAG: enoyl-CoA hydratase/isomerase family protein [Bacteroidales bacterium]|nr:enoyl-CoA hydratase/isomerase family protein [Bacteroidales bacterium]